CTFLYHLLGLRVPGTKHADRRRPPQPANLVARTVFSTGRRNRHRTALGRWAGRTTGGLACHRATVLHHHGAYGRGGLSRTAPGQRNRDPGTSGTSHAHLLGTRR